MPTTLESKTEGFENHASWAKFSSAAMYLAHTMYCKQGGLQWRSPVAVPSRKYNSRSPYGHTRAIPEPDPCKDPACMSPISSDRRPRRVGGRRKLGPASGVVSTTWDEIRLWVCLIWLYALVDRISGNGKTTRRNQQEE